MKTLLRYRNWLWAVLQSFGPWGVFLMAGMDGAGVPLPGAADAVLASYVYGSPHNAWLYVLLASAGSSLGCLVLYGIGYLGGEVLIERRMSKEKFEKIRADFDQHSFLTLAIPALLPPPFPFKIVVLSAGAFEMHWTRFLAAIFAGRVVRFGALAILTVVFGPHVIGMFNSIVRRHPLSALALLALVTAIAVYVHRTRRGTPVPA